MAGRNAARNRIRRAQARPTAQATAIASFTPAPLHFGGLGLLGARTLLARRSGRRRPRPVSEPDLLAVPDRFGRIGDDPFVHAQTSGDFDIGSKVASNTHLLHDDVIVNSEGRDLHGVVPKNKSIGRDRDRVRVGGKLKMYARKRARGEGAILVVGDQFDKQRPRFLVDRMRSRLNPRFELAIGYSGNWRIAVMP